MSPMHKTKRHAPALLFLVVALFLCGCNGFRPGVLALRADPSITASLKAPSDVSGNTGGGVDVSVLLESGTYDFMGGSFTLKATPRITQVGGRYDWEISNLIRYTQSRVIIHLGALGFANIPSSGELDGGIGGMAQVRHEWIVDDGFGHHGLALFAGGQIDGMLVSQDIDFYISAGLGYTYYLDIR